MKCEVFEGRKKYNCCLPFHNNTTQQYNKTLDAVASYLLLDVGDVDPLLLDASKPDLLLTQIAHMAELCRGYVNGEGQVAWHAVDREVRFASGLVFPKLALPHFKVTFFFC